MPYKITHSKLPGVWGESIAKVSKVESVTARMVNESGPEVDFVDSLPPHFPRPGRYKEVRLGEWARY